MAEAAKPGERATGGGPFAFLSRRRFLRAGLAAGGVLVGGLGGGWLWLRGCAPSVDGLSCLDDHEYRTLQMIVEVLFAPGEVFDVDVGAMDLPRAVDTFLNGEPEQNRTDLRRALTLIELGPLVFDHRVTTFSRLSAAERRAHFESWMTSDDPLRRQASLAFRKILNLLFYDREEVWPHIGYPGPSLQAP